MIGYPFTSSRPLNDVRIVNASDDCSSGCTLDTARANSIANNTLWTYDGAAYTTIDTS